MRFVRLGSRLFVEWVGTEALFFTASPHHGRSVAEPLCLHSCNYYLTLAVYQQVTTLIPQGHIRTQGTPISKGASFLLTDGAIRKGRQHHLVFLFWGV